MTSVSNKTRKALSVPLPGGKKLFLGPGKSGQVSLKAIEHPPLLALVEAGEIEIVGGPKSGGDGGGGGDKIQPSGRGPNSAGGIRHTGDR